LQLAPQKVPQETLSLQVTLQLSPQLDEISVAWSLPMLQSLPQTAPQRTMLLQKSLQPLPSPAQP
jgi:hypothetical protein